MPPVTVHSGATVHRDHPLSVTTPRSPWSYAVSFPVEAPSGAAAVVEVVVQGRHGCAGVSIVDLTGQHLRHEVMVQATPAVRRIQQVVAPGERALLMVRTGADAGPAAIDILEIGVRPVTPEERAASDAVSRLEPASGWSAYFGSYAASVPEQLRSLWFERLDAETVRPWLEGLLLLVAPGEQISRAACVSGVYEPNTALVLKSWLRPGAIMLDVGANAGLFTMLGSRWVGPSGHILAIEPSPRERARLSDHLSVNAIGNVEVIAAAVANREGSGDLLVATRAHSGLNTLAPTFAYSGVMTAERVRVPLTTLDTQVERAALPRVDVIKLDIEGGEYAALAGAASTLRRFRPRLLVEIVPSALDASGATVDEVERLFEDAEYRLFEIDERAGLRPIRELGELHDHNVAAIPRESV